jgi:hypothetical protein
VIVMRKQYERLQEKGRKHLDAFEKEARIGMVVELEEIQNRRVMRFNQFFIFTSPSLIHHSLHSVCKMLLLLLLLIDGYVRKSGPIGNGSDQKGGRTCTDHFNLAKEKRFVQ